MMRVLTRKMKRMKTSKRAKTAILRMTRMTSWNSIRPHSPHREERDVQVRAGRRAERGGRATARGYLLVAAEEGRKYFLSFQISQIRNTTE